jgi:hypothetical protein
MSANSIWQTWDKTDKTLYKARVGCAVDANPLTSAAALKIELPKSRKIRPYTIKFSGQFLDVAQKNAPN